MPRYVKKKRILLLLLRYVWEEGVLRARHPGVLAAKVRDFGSNLLKWA